MLRDSARALAACLCAAAIGCASAPRLEDPARSGVWGYLRLVPRDGLPQTQRNGTRSYADPRLADAELVDYSRPGFAVVYLEHPPAPSTLIEVTLRSRLDGLVFQPERAALPLGGQIRIRNQSETPRVVTSPSLGLVRQLAPGELLTVSAPEPGEIEIFIPGEARAAARIFVAPGPYAVVDSVGRFELLGLSPGRRRVHVWHPRFPGRQRAVELAAGEVERVDFELGVGLDANAE